MGQDKALLTPHGIPQAQWAYDLLKPYCEEVVLSCRKGQFDGTPLADLPQAHDQMEDGGPLQGIRDVMATQPDAAWLLMACDLPRVSTEEIEGLLTPAAKEGCQAVCYLDPESQLPEPMLAWMAPEFLDHLEAHIATGNRCARKAFIRLEERLDGRQLARPDAMWNMNHPHEVPA